MAISHPKRFSESSIVPSFLFREAESESFPCEYTRTTLVNEPDKYGEIIAVVYEQMKRTQEMLFADWAQKYKGFFLCPIRSRHPFEFLEMVR